MSRWTIKEKRDDTTWWMIRGGAFSNVINKDYPNRLFEEKEDAEMYSNNLNRRSGRKTKVVKVEYKDAKEY